MQGLELLQYQGHVSEVIAYTQVHWVCLFQLYLGRVMCYLVLRWQAADSQFCAFGTLRPR